MGLFWHTNRVEAGLVSSWWCIQLFEKNNLINLVQLGQHWGIMTPKSVKVV